MKKLSVPNLNPTNIDEVQKLVEFGEDLVDEMFDWIRKHEPTTKGIIIRTFVGKYPSCANMVETIYEEIKSEFTIDVSGFHGVEYVSVE